MEWQPIETAPKDGRKLVLYAYETFLYPCKWDDKRKCWLQWNMDGFETLGWCKLESYEVPTHWLELVIPTA